MNHKVFDRVRKTAALLTSLALILAQLALPVAALAVADVSGLPLVTVNYTNLDLTTGFVQATPSATGDGIETAFYWAQLPETVDWNAGVTVTAMGDPAYLYLPDGTVPIGAGNAQAVDGMTITTYIQAFTDMTQPPVMQYPLYLSSAPIPPIESEEPVATTGNVLVYYYVDGSPDFAWSEPINGLEAGDQYITANLQGDYAGYSVQEENPQYVNVVAGQTAEIAFHIFAPQPEEPVATTGNVLVYYYVDGSPDFAWSEPINGLEAGEQYITANLQGDYAGYTVQEENPQYVNVAAGQTAEIAFHIFAPQPQEPVATTGIVQIEYYVDGAQAPEWVDTKEDVLAGQQLPFPAELPERYAGYTVQPESPQYINVVADQTSVIAYTITAPEVVPEQPAATTGTVKVSYIDEPTDALLWTDTKTEIEPGQRSFYPELIPDYADYDVTGDSIRTINVVAGETAEIAFYIAERSIAQAPPQLETQINQDGKINKNSVNLRATPHALKDNSNRVVSVDKDTPVYVYGSLTVADDMWYSIKYNDIDCYVMASFVDLVSATSTVNIEYYVDGAATPAWTDTKTDIPVGDQQFPVELPGDYAGYTVQEQSPQTVTVKANETAVVQYHIAKPAPQTSTVNIEYYVDGAATPAWTDTKTNVPVGDQQFPVELPGDYAGYIVQEQSPQTVTVKANETAVVQYHIAKPAPQTSTVNIEYYVDGAATPAWTDTKTNVPVGDQQFPVELPGDYAGYTVQEQSPQTVTVKANETAVVQYHISKPAPQTSTVNIEYYVDGAATPAWTDTKTNVPVGDQQFPVELPGDYAGYTVQEQSPQTVTVKANETAVVQYHIAKPAPVATTGTVNIEYYVNGIEQPIWTDTKTDVPEGNHQYAAELTGDYAAYTVQNANPQTVAVKAGETSVIAFRIAPPAPVRVTFSFVDEAGKEIKPEETQNLTVATYNAKEYAGATPDGYTYLRASAEQIIVSGGTATPSHVTFTYKENVTTAVIEVRYLNQIGEQIAGSPEYVERGAGDWDITPTKAYIPAGYSLSTNYPQSVRVSVGSDLVARPNVVEFRLVSDSVHAKVIVRYLHVTNGSLVATQEKSLQPGPHTIVAEAGALPTGYALSDVNTPQPVTVSDQGVPSVSEITFRCQPTQSQIYTGYAVTTQQTALRSAYNTQDTSITATLPAGTLLFVNGQATQQNILWNSVVMELGDRKAGIVQDSATRHITKAEADQIIAAYNQQNPSTPAQTVGYYITIVNGAPLRTYADANSAAREYLPLDTVVYVTGQEYRNNIGWHMASHNSESGYVRLDQVRRMTDAEVQRYVAGLNPGAQPTKTNSVSPYDPYGPSSYGYVTSSTVNFRQTPNGTRIKTLNRYAFALIIGSREVEGVTWYYVNQSGTTGWVHGDYFHQLNLTELSSFLNSNEYRQGLLNNSNLSTGTTGTTNNAGTGGTGSTGTSSGGSTGSAKPGNITSVEDWNVGTWQNTGVTTQTSYAPFNPYATATPAATASVSPSASVEPTATFVIGTMIPITYEDESKETQTNAAPWGLIGAGVALIAGAGGIYAYAANQNKKRRAAASRAAASRRSAAAQGSPQTQQAQSPYARRAAAMPPVAPPIAGTQQNRQQTRAGSAIPPVPTVPSATPLTGATKNPYSGGSITGMNAAGESPQTRSPYATQNPYAAQTQNPYAAQPQKPYTGAQTQNPFDAVKSEILKTETPPQSPSAAQTQNPYASPVSGVQGAAPAGAPQRSNPYARPIGAGDAPASASADTTRRRATRMQRYHAAEDGSDENGENS